MTRAEVKKKVYERFPMTKAERKGCETEKAMRNAARKEYEKKLIREMQEKKEYE